MQHRVPTVSSGRCATRLQRGVKCLAAKEQRLPQLLLGGATSLVLLGSNVDVAQAAYWFAPPSPEEKMIAIKSNTIKVVEGTKQMIAHSDMLASDAATLLEFDGVIPEEEKRLLAEIKEAASLVSVISKDVLAQQQFRLAQEVLAVAAPPPSSPEPQLELAEQAMEEEPAAAAAAAVEVPAAPAAEEAVAMQPVAAAAAEAEDEAAVMLAADMAEVATETADARELAGNGESVAAALPKLEDEAEPAAAVEVVAAVAAAPAAAEVSNTAASAPAVDAALAAAQEEDVAPQAKETVALLSAEEVAEAAEQEAVASLLPAPVEAAAVVLAAFGLEPPAFALGPTSA